MKKNFNKIEVDERGLFCELVLAAFHNIKANTEAEKKTRRKIALCIGVFGMLGYLTELDVIERRLIKETQTNRSICHLRYLFR